MKKNIKSFKALALLSGGLDSMLAIKLIQEQNIEVEAVIFKSNFYSSQRGIKAAEFLNIKYHIVNLTEKMIKIIENPKFGYGKNLNPCIDCHLLMIKSAAELMKKIQADFIITGEVVGQRAKSQNYNALRLIEKESGIEGRLLRPLSAKRLEPTKIELEGIVDREKLLDIAGRNREIQMKLAEKYNITDYPSPAGGCLLTVPEFSDRLRINLKLKKLTPIEVELLKSGRHFLTGNNNKIIVGRNKEENLKILNTIDSQYLIFELADNMPGPVTVVDNLELEDRELIAAASLTARYSKFRNNERVAVEFYTLNNKKNSKKIQIKPLPYTELGLKLI